MTPGEALAAVLEEELLEWNVYPSPSDNVKAPAIVLQPDEPWISPGPALGTLTEQWIAMAVVPAADPRSGVGSLRDALLTVIDVLPDDWALRDVGRPLLGESTGVPYLAAGARLTYSVG